MATNTATVIDLAQYRRNRVAAPVEQAAATTPMVIMPVMVVAWWSMMPVYMVPGYA